MFLVKNNWTKRSSFLLLCVMVIFSGCASEPEKKTYSKEEEVRLDNQAGVELAKSFEQNLTIHQPHVELSIYLRNLAQSLLETLPNINESPIGVFVVSEQNKIWTNYSLPGIRIYLSRDFVKNVKFENELASAISIELAHIYNRHILKKIGDKQVESTKKENVLDAIYPGPYSGLLNIDFFGAQGLFRYTQEEKQRAVFDAVGTLYRAGFDPRGSISLFELYSKNMAHSPYSAEEIHLLRESAHRKIVEFKPLQNPIVRSAEFIKNQKRIMEL